MRVFHLVLVSEIVSSHQSNSKCERAREEGVGVQGGGARGKSCGLKAALLLAVGKGVGLAKAGLDSMWQGEEGPALLWQSTPSTAAGHRACRDTHTVVKLGSWSTREAQRQREKEREVNSHSQDCSGKHKTRTIQPFFLSLS